MKNQCRYCGGKFGLVRYYHWRQAFCSKACLIRFDDEMERKVLVAKEDFLPAQRAFCERPLGACSGREEQIVLRPLAEMADPPSARRWGSIDALMLRGLHQISEDLLPFATS
jgi:hypothetical protein